jgi:invasion protein IalB
MKHLKWLMNSVLVTAVAGCGMATATLALAQTQAQQAPPPQAAAPQQQALPQTAWRVECVGDGKMLECQVVQQLVNREDGKQVVLVSVRLPPKAPSVMVLQLPLGLNVAEPVQVAVDKGVPNREPVQTCIATGCFLTLPLDDKFLLAMRTGTALKITVQDSGKHPITLEVSLLGFGVAFDKAK